MRAAWSAYDAADPACVDGARSFSSAQAAEGLMRQAVARLWPRGSASKRKAAR